MSEERINQLIKIAEDQEQRIRTLEKPKWMLYIAILLAAITIGGIVSAPTWRELGDKANINTVIALKEQIARHQDAAIGRFNTIEGNIHNHEPHNVDLPKG